MLARENLRSYIFIANLAMLKLDPTRVRFVLNCTCSVAFCHILTQSQVDFTKAALIMSEEGWVRDRKLVARGHCKFQSPFLMSAFVEKCASCVYANVCVSYSTCWNVHVSCYLELINKENKHNNQPDYCIVIGVPQSMNANQIHASPKDTQGMLYYRSWGIGWSSLVIWIKSLSQAKNMVLF